MASRRRGFRDPRARSHSNDSGQTSHGGGGQPSSPPSAMVGGAGLLDAVPRGGAGWSVQQAAHAVPATGAPNDSCMEALSADSERRQDPHPRPEILRRPIMDRGVSLKFLQDIASKLKTANLEHVTCRDFVERCPVGAVRPHTLLSVVEAYMDAGPEQAKPTFFGPASYFVVHAWDSPCGVVKLVQDIEDTVERLGLQHDPPFFFVEMFAVAQRRPEPPPDHPLGEPPPCCPRDDDLEALEECAQDAKRVGVHMPAIPSDEAPGVAGCFRCLLEIGFAYKHGKIPDVIIGKDLEAMLVGKIERMDSMKAMVDSLVLQRVRAPQLADARNSPDVAWMLQQINERLGGMGELERTAPRALGCAMAHALRGIISKAFGDDPGASLMRGIVFDRSVPGLRDAGFLHAAHETFLEAIALLAPRPNVGRSRMLFRLACLEVELEMYERAADHLWEALDIQIVLCADDHPRLDIRLAEIRVKLGFVLQHTKSAETHDAVAALLKAIDCVNRVLALDRGQRMEALDALVAAAGGDDFSLEELRRITSGPDHAQQRATVTTQAPPDTQCTEVFRSLIPLMAEACFALSNLDLHHEGNADAWLHRTLVLNATFEDRVNHPSVVVGLHNLSVVHSTRVALAPLHTSASADGEQAAQVQDGHARDRARARNHSDGALSISEDTPDAPVAKVLVNRGHVEHLHRDQGAVERFLTRAEEEAGGNLSVLAEAWELRATIAWKHGHHEEAKFLYGKLVQLRTVIGGEVNMQTARAMHNLGVASCQCGDAGGGREWLNRALRIKGMIKTKATSSESVRVSPGTEIENLDPQHAPNSTDTSTSSQAAGLAQQIEEPTHTRWISMLRVMDTEFSR